MEHVFNILYPFLFDLIGSKLLKMTEILTEVILLERRICKRNMHFGVQLFVQLLKALEKNSYFIHHFIVLIYELTCVNLQRFRKYSLVYCDILSVYCCVIINQFTVILSYL